MSGGGSGLETLEEVQQEEKKRTKKSLFLAIFFLILAAGIASGSMKVMNDFQIKTFSTEDSIVTTMYSSSWFILTIFYFSFIIIPCIMGLIFSYRKKLGVRHYLKRLLLIIILTIPFIVNSYFLFYCYLDIGNRSITYDPYWSTEKRVYAWEDIQSVVIDQATSRSRRFDYYIYFEDGTKLDIWGNTRMNIQELKQVDDKIRAKGIPKYMYDQPNESNILEIYADNPEEEKMVLQIIRE